MDEKYFDDPLDSLLDEQSDDDFGLPEIRSKYNHGARISKHGNLKTWTAADFSSIYVRFYPHLLRHAKRYLSSELQAEEVVQDAFLYVMTALPEIDSELGVLKFLKWKVKLLALDVIRATPNQREILVDSFDDEISSQVTDSGVERFDDLAIVRAALAKLSPRHREALLATVYEEKSSVEVAAKMGISDNAARQLVFRARAAFKKALVGEAEVAGKSVAEILSIAAKRAASSIKDNSRALSVVLLLAIGFSWLPTFGPQMSQQVELVAESPIPNAVSSAETLVDSEDSVSGAPKDDGTSRIADLPSPDHDAEPETISEASKGAETQTLALAQSPASAEADESAIASSETQALDVSYGSTAEQEIVSVLGQTLGQGLVIQQSMEPNFQTKAAGIPMELRSNSGLQAFFFFNPENQEISNVLLRVEVDGKPYFGIPSQFGYGVSRTSISTTITHTSSGISFVDQFGAVKNFSELQKAVVSIQVNLDELDRPGSSDLTVKLSA